MRGIEGMTMEFEYPVQDVLEKLRMNRAKHKTDYEKAMEGYYAERAELLAAVKAKLLANIANVEKALAEDNTQKLSVDRKVMKDVKLGLEVPQNYLEHYDDMIGQLEMTSQEIVKFSTAVYKQICQDDWEWSRDWKMSNSKYLGG